MGTLTLSLHAQGNNENLEIQFQITSHTRRTPISLISKLQSASETIFHPEHQLHTATKLGVYTLIPVHAV